MTSSLIITSCTVSQLHVTCVGLKEIFVSKDKLQIHKQQKYKCIGKANKNKMQTSNKNQQVRLSNPERYIHVWYKYIVFKGKERK